MNKFTIYFILAFTLTTFSSDTPKTPTSAFQPDKASPFKAPKDEKIAKLVRDYRKTYTKGSGIELSPLHWNLGVVVYINRDFKTYVNNHLAYLQDLMGDEDEEEDDEEESEGGNSSKTKAKAYEIGTVVVKENYAMKDGKAVAPVFLTIMIKREVGYDKANGDWQYIQTDVQGNMILNGNHKNQQVYKVCSECHANIKGRDYIFSTYYKDPTAGKTIDSSKK